MQLFWFFKNIYSKYNSLLIHFTLVLLFGLAEPVLAVASASNGLCLNLFMQTQRRFEYSTLVQSDRFETSRDLYDYFRELGNVFKTALFQLSPNQRWIDFGAGKGLAAEDYLKLVGPEQAAKVSIYSYKYKRWFPRFKYPILEVNKDKFFEDYETIPKYDLGSDVFGVFSYTKHLDRYFELTLSNLIVGGQLIISSRFFVTTIQLLNGDRVSVHDWLNTIPGLLAKMQNGVLVIEKKNEFITIPKLKLESFFEDAPPLRQFKVL